MVVPEKIRALGVHILLPTVEDVLASREHKMLLGFLTTDALKRAVTRRHPLSHIATNDPDFQRVASRQVWRPSPLPPSA
jgi:predicted nucleic acid-binding protein